MKRQHESIGKGRYHRIELSRGAIALVRTRLKRFGLRFKLAWRPNRGCERLRSLLGCRSNIRELFPTLNAAR